MSTYERQSRASGREYDEQQQSERRGVQQGDRRSGRGQRERNSDEMESGGDEARYWRQQRDEDYGPRGRQGYYSETPGQEHGGPEYSSGQDQEDEGRFADYGGHEGGPGYGGMGGNYGGRSARGQGRFRAGNQDYDGYQRQDGRSAGRGRQGGDYGGAYSGEGRFGGSSGRSQSSGGEFNAGAYGNQSPGGGSYGRSQGQGGREYGSGRGFQSEQSGSGWSGSEGAAYGSQSTMGRGEHYGKGPKGYQRSDERIKEEINECFTYDSHLDASEIDVSVSQGEVTLTGRVNDRRAKRHAEDLAEDIRGVTEVHNQLRTSDRTEGSSAKSRDTDSGRSEGKSEKGQRGST